MTPTESLISKQEAMGGDPTFDLFTKVAKSQGQTKPTRTDKLKSRSLPNLLDIDINKDMESKHPNLHLSTKFTTSTVDVRDYIAAQQKSQTFKHKLVSGLKRLKVKYPTARNDSGMPFRDKLDGLNNFHHKNSKNQQTSKLLHPLKSLHLFTRKGTSKPDGLKFPDLPRCSSDVTLNNTNKLPNNNCEATDRVRLLSHNSERRTNRFGTASIKRALSCDSII